MANKHPFLNQPLEVRWSELDPEYIESDIRLAIENSQKQIDSIADQDLATVSYESTLIALEEATKTLEEGWGYVSHLDSVSNSEDLRKAKNAVLSEVTTFFSGIALNEKLWKVIKAFSQSEEAKMLNAVRKRHLEETIYSFEKSGADLDPATKEKLKRINQSLSEKTQKFSENVLDATNAWEYVTEEEGELAGLPEMLKEAARQDALAKGYGTEEKPHWRFTLQMPSLGPALTYLEDAKLREKIWRASSKVGAEDPYDNSSLVLEILELRHKKAELLGRKDFADFVTERRMASSGKNANDFIEDLHIKVFSAFQKEIDELEEFVSKAQNRLKDHLEPWDVSFWSEKQRKDQYEFDEEELRPYFPIESVIGGLFSLSERLFKIEINERPVICEGEVVNAGKGLQGDPVEVWHKDVQFYEMRDGDLHLGSFYADWFPRESKRGGAWMNALQMGGPDGNGGHTPNLGLITGNLTPPSGNKPSLLNHREVETVFHEFGHLIHHLCGMVEVPSLNGIHVPWDFVELPSQIMENFCWERKSLDFFAKHYETGESIPDDLFNKMLAARNYGAASATIRQLNFAKMDLDLHRIYIVLDEKEELDPWLNEQLKDYRMPLKTVPSSIVRRFSHLFSSATGYAAGYYSYKWAEVLDADAFGRFLDDGVLSEKVGFKFREKILSKGNSRDVMELFIDFMGREPKVDALLKRCGLIS